jgi:ABC-type multidrug transport system fused ATPase/permease subunit
MYCWSASAERVAKRIRTKYLESILFQEVGWFDKKDTGDLTTRLIADIALIQDGTGDKVGLVFQFGTTFLGGFALAFWRGWKLALVLVAAFPLLGLTSFLMAKVLAQGTSAVCY